MVAKVERAGAGRFQSLGADCLFQAQNGLHRAQPVQWLVAQQGLDHLTGRLSQPCCHLPAIGWGPFQVSSFVLGIVFQAGMPLAWL